MNRIHSLRTRLMLAFAGFTLLVATVFGLYTAIFAYTVEDHFFDAMLEREALQQAAHHARHGSWNTPHETWMQVVIDAEQLPDGIAALLRKEPLRTEFSGSEGRHYHLHALHSPDGSTAWLLAEVGDQLVVRPQRDALLSLLFWSGVIMVVLALLLGAWLAQRTTAPLSRLVRLIDTTDPAHLPPVFARDFQRDEVGVLARALEALIKRVQSFVEREREFTRDASHELRTPLTVIRGATERMATEAQLPDSVRSSLTQIRQSALQLEQTVTTLLVLAREEALPDHGISTRVRPLVERIIVEQSLLLEDKPVELHLDLPSDLSSTIPASVLNILLANLIGNAFAHTREGRIDIDAESDCLRIANPGAAITDSDFLPFAKSDASAGFGLGLSIVQRVCARHGIAVRIDSTATHTVASLPLHPR